MDEMWESFFFLLHARLDLAFSVSVANCYMQAPKEAHLNLVKMILRYLCGYPSRGIFFAQREDNTLHGFSDADYAQDADDMIPTGAYVFNLKNTPISWSSKK